ncbi:organic hydroperoxide resistance protein [soil metagenome]|jgi:Ohr subfamily peroxiredoxin
MKTIHTAEVTATGGRKGHIKSNDGILDMPVQVPEGAGGKGDATNPEQLFAAGFASCFQSALLVAALKKNIQLDPESTVRARVSLLGEDHQYALAVSVDVNLKGVDGEQAQSLIDEAHDICPISAGVRGNIEVEVNLV